MTSDPQTILRERFALSELRPIQQRIVDHVLAGRDALVVMPTGSGKSLCFQLPALCLCQERATALVFSPLIALMEDQVLALRRRGIRAQFINSTLTRKQRHDRYRRLARGEYELIYATPERMKKPEFREALCQVPGGVPLLAVDEAHCISAWGHDLRPTYQQIGEFRAWLASIGSQPVTIALTATATRRVRDDIRFVLGATPTSMPLFALPIDRPNLHLAAREVWDDDDKTDAIVRTLGENPGAAIVYFSLIRDLERFADRLRPLMPERTIEIYHGRLDPREKQRISRRFSEGHDMLVLATNAFGMGVDRPDIRSIIHAQMPASVEAYAQEIGRAGRDGRDADCLLLMAQDDIAICQQFIEWQNPPAPLLREVAIAFERSRDADLCAEDLRLAIRGKAGPDPRFDQALITLEKLGVLEQTPICDRYRLVRPLDDDEIREDQIEEKKRRDLTRLLEVVRMAREPDIASFLRDYFELDETAQPQP